MGTQLLPLVPRRSEIFFEHVPVQEILMDNATALKSKLMQEFLDKWNVSPYFRAAYRASGNGIFERHHRTIKSMTEKANISPAEAVYNMAPRSGQDEKSVPQFSVFSMEAARDKRGRSEKDLTSTSPAKIGEMWVKPPHLRGSSTLIYKLLIINPRTLKI